MKLNLKVEMDSGAAALFWALGFFGLCALSKWAPAVAASLVGVLVAWAAGLGEYLLKRHGKDKVGVERLKIDGGSGA